MFLADMGERPAGTSLERKDNSKGYCKENCKWADRFEQAKNRRTSRWLVCFGERMILAEAARRYNIDPETLSLRLQRGLPVEVALTKPVKVYRRGK